VPEQSERFVLAESGSSEARHCFAAVAALIFAKLTYAEVEHVGSTAVPGCLTKGDVDVLVRVSSADFPQALSVLHELLTRSTRNEPTDDYVEYDYSAGAVSASIQLVAAGGTHDDFHRLKAMLTSDPEALERFNALKLSYAGRSMTEYRLAKANLIESLLAASTVGEKGERTVKPGIYE
jgi:GrpB-like predicted nucleotidyltransferase (UPF0157 family)